MRPLRLSFFLQPPSNISNPTPDHGAQRARRNSFLTHPVSKEASPIFFNFSVHSRYPALLPNLSAFGAAHLHFVTDIFSASRCLNLSG